MKRRVYYFIIPFAVLLFTFTSCSKDQPESALLNFKSLDSCMTVISNLLDTAVIGDIDGTYPRENAIDLENALVNLQVGKSKALAGEFILQYEVDNYCIAAIKAIQDFEDSYQLTLPAGTSAELIVYGVDEKGRIEFGASSEYGGSNTFTVESWIKYNNGFYESAIGDFIATFNNTAIPNEGWMINFMGANLRSTIAMGPQSGRLLEFGAAYPTNYGNWNHIAMVYDASLPEDQLKMYLNGKLFFSKTNDIVDNNKVLQSYQPNIENTNMWAFQEPTDISRCMTGYIKKFRMWSTAKSMTEINTLMTADVVGTESNLICAWDFTAVPVDAENIPDKTGRHSAKLVGKYKWNSMN